METCPHYLTFTAEEVPDGATEFKCCPPIREVANREQLWAELAGGVIDAVVSDHSPSPVPLKHRDTGDFGAAWGGIASLQVGLPAVWSAARRRGHQLSDVVSWMADRPARLAGLARRVGSPWASTLTCASSPPIRRSSWTPGNWPTATRSLRTTAGCCAERFARRGCAGAASTSTDLRAAPC